MNHYSRFGQRVRANIPGVTLFFGLLVISHPFTGDAQGVSFSVYTQPAAVAEPLPVTLGYIKARSLQQKVELKWHTLSESNTGYFIIEKSRGTGYTAIDSLAAAGQSGAEKEYIAYDNSPSPGTSHYRIRMVDKNGAVKYSEAIQFFFEKTSAFSIYPNPSSGTATVLHPAGVTGDKISVADLTGKQVFTQDILKGKTFTNLDIQSLPKGSYRVTLKVSGVTKTEQIVLQ